MPIDFKKDKKTEEMCGLVEFHQDCLTILSAIDRVCKKHNIKYSTYSGTMIGQIRHHGFIPWDDDVDLIMDRVNYDKFLEVWKDEGNFKILTPMSYNKEFVDVIVRIVYTKNSYKNFGDFNRYPILSHPWVDIFVLDEAPKSKLRFKLHSLHLKVLYGLMSSKKKIDIHLKRPLIERIAYNSCKIIGHIFSLTWLYRRFNKVSKRYQNKKNTVYHASNSMLDIDYRIYKEDINETLYLPFMNVQVQCYKGYDHMLKDQYGNYLEPRIDSSSWIRHFDLSKCSDEEIIKYYLN